MKYELTDDTIEVNGVTLYRIRALKDFADVKAGELGGYVQSIDNLSQEGDCWVFDNAQVYDNARVFHSAQVSDDAQVYNESWVFGTANVSGSAVITFSYVFGDSVIGGMAVIENSHVRNSEVGGFAEVIGRYIEGHRIMNTADLVLV